MFKTVKKQKVTYLSSVNTQSIFHHNNDVVRFEVRLLTGLPSM